MLRIVPATAAHAAYVAEHARPEDVAELAAGSGSTPAEALAYGMRVSPFSFAGVVGDVPVAVFGCTPASMAYGIGCPWMVATPVLERYARRFVAVSRPCLDEFHRVFPHLVNFVDNRNVKAIRWLEWLGFSFYPPVPYGVSGLPFMMFERRNDPCANPLR